MTAQPCCSGCGAKFDPQKWDFETHKPGCLYAQKTPRTVPDVSGLEISTAPADKKMIFLDNWKIVFPDLWRLNELQPVYAPEYQFDDGTFKRGWLFDFAWVPQKVAVEIDGGNRLVKYDRNGIPRAVGRHTQDADYEKINAAQELGWIVLRFTVTMLQTRPWECCQQVYRVLMNRSKSNQ